MLVRPLIEILNIHNLSIIRSLSSAAITALSVIAAEDKDLLLNKRQDLSNICPHNRRFYFK